MFADLKKKIEKDLVQFDFLKEVEKSFPRTQGSAFNVSSDPGTGKSTVAKALLARARSLTKDGRAGIGCACGSTAYSAGQFDGGTTAHDLFLALAFAPRRQCQAYARVADATPIQSW